MDDSLLLSLRLVARRPPSLHEMAAVMEDIQALYAASRIAEQQEEPLGVHYAVERRRFNWDAQAGLDDLLAEFEYLRRSTERLRRQRDADDALASILASQRVLADRLFLAVRDGSAGVAGESLSWQEAMQVRRVSMASPYEIVTSIPPEYWTTGGLVLFLSAVENKFNFVERIRTERVELAARRAEARASATEAEEREVQAAYRLRQLQQRVARDRPDSHGTEIGPDPASPFRLESGSVVVEHPEAPGLPLADE